MKHTDEMARFTNPPAGCVIYFMLSIVINLFILILRISAQEVQNNATFATVAHRFDGNAILNSEINFENASAIGEYPC